MATEFQVRLGGDWKDYHDEEDRIIKRAWKSGFPKCQYNLRGQKYSYDFEDMKQINQDTGRKRDIRQPYGWKQPKKPLVRAGPTMTIKVPQGRAGTAIKVPHPDDKSVLFTVRIPANAPAGSEMLVPVPTLEDARASMAAVNEHRQAAKDAGGGGMSTGAKVAIGGGAAVVIGAGVVAGVLIAEHGVDGAADLAGDVAGDAGAAIADAAGDAGDFLGDAAADAGIADAAGDAAAAVGDFAGDAGDVVGDAAGDAGDFIVDAADTAGDFIMDLF